MEVNKKDLYKVGDLVTWTKQPLKHDGSLVDMWIEEKNKYFVDKWFGLVTAVIRNEKNKIIRLELLGKCEPRSVHSKNAGRSSASVNSNAVMAKTIISAINLKPVGHKINEKI